MSNLIILDQVSLAYGVVPLLDKVKLTISKGERVCLIGRNGTGKSSLLKVIEGLVVPDAGTVWRKPNLVMAKLDQELPQNNTSTIYEFVASGLAQTGEVLAAYHHLLEKITHSHTEKDLLQLQELQQKIDAQNGWQFDQRINTILSRLELKADQRVAELSGGWQRRAALARSLVTSPELLLLDEPTNHLDISAIQWLEEELISWGIGLIFITHDRALLQRLATRIIELDRGHLTSWPGDYDNFLRRKEEMLHAEAKQHAEFDKKLAEEERWIRQGVKARRTRNEGRVRALEALRVQRSKRREVEGKASFNVNEAEKSGHIVIEAKNISFSVNDQLLINKFSTRIMRGDRIGLIGPNGIGKSTLLNILLGNLAPQQGSVVQGTKLKIAYFDQLRKTLNFEKTVIDNMREVGEVVEINGKQQHLMSYLGDFLFTPARAMTPIKALSGGECNRLLLARLFCQPANLLVLDEPTNDLDIETLELLEELLSNYQGTLLIVSHDRTFLDNVVTSTIVFEGNGVIEEYVGGYQDWLRQRKMPTVNSVKSPKPMNSENVPVSPKIIKKLTFKEQRELTELPKKIEALELEQSELQELVNKSDFYKNAPEFIESKLVKATELSNELEKCYQRWNELESMV